jgi:hypothetical protein
MQQVVELPLHLLSSDKSWQNFFSQFSLHLMQCKNVMDGTKFHAIEKKILLLKDKISLCFMILSEREVSSSFNGEKLIKTLNLLSNRLDEKGIDELSVSFLDLMLESVKSLTGWVRLLDKDSRLDLSSFLTAMFRAAVIVWES